MIRRLYETLTGRPWTTIRSCTTEYGPPPGARHAAQLAAYSDAQLLHHGHEILARLKQHQHTPGCDTGTPPTDRIPGPDRWRCPDVTTTAGPVDTHTSTPTPVDTPTSTPGRVATDECDPGPAPKLPTTQHPDPSPPVT